MKNLECEERVMITFEQYQALLAAYVAIDPNFKILNIENTYLDDDDLSIRKSHRMLRKRSTNGEIELTLKIKKDDGEIEINETMEHHPEIDKELNGLFDRCHPIASLRTNRVEAKENDYLVVIDQNIYNGIIDYDLEVEASSMKNAKDAILKICERFNLDYKKGYTSKSSRAFSTRKI